MMNGIVSFFWSLSFVCDWLSNGQSDKKLSSFQEIFRASGAWMTASVVFHLILEFSTRRGLEVLACVRFFRFDKVKTPLPVEGRSRHRLERKQTTPESVIKIKMKVKATMRTNRINAMLLGLCLGASCAHAEVITQTQTIADNTPGASYSLSFNKFDTAGGTRQLDSIQIIFNLYMYGGSVAIDNDSAYPQTLTAYISLNGGLTSSDVGPYNGPSSDPWATIHHEISRSFNLEATSGDTLDQYNVTGQGDNVIFDGPTAADAVKETQTVSVNSAAFADYVGPGTYTISAKMEQTSHADGNGQYAVTMMQTYGDVTVNYTYTPVPEPATAAMACAGLLMLLRRRRA